MFNKKNGRNKNVLNKQQYRYDRPCGEFDTFNFETDFYVSTRLALTLQNEDNCKGTVLQLLRF